jgi:hypothetical protein
VSGNKGNNNGDDNAVGWDGWNQRGINGNSNGNGNGSMMSVCDVFERMQKESICQTICKFATIFFSLPIRPVRH